MFTYSRVHCCFNKSEVSAVLEMIAMYVLCHQQAIFTSLQELLFFDKNARKTWVSAETAMHGCIKLQVTKDLNKL